MIGKLDQALRFHETALSLRSQRQQLLASNIANADTPNYKARDIDFSKALAGALGASGAQGPLKLATSAAGHLGAAGGAPAVAPQYRGVRQDSLDNNTVDLDAERGQFTDNALRYEAGITMINAQIKGLLAAIQG
ncbi:MAG: flagellar basal body rod protein FlgB [Noviherbaspirillum sp.]